MLRDQNIRNPSQDDTSGSKHSTEKSLQKTGDVKESSESLTDVNYEDEIDKLLSDLGPRYVDWPGDNPLPVDADLLPNLVPGYQPPFRLLPYGARRALGMKESTSLRRIARTLPPHFALGILALLPSRCSYSNTSIWWMLLSFLFNFVVRSCLQEEVGN